ncbi:GNAT family N-acetyltransferase [Paenibacillus fonticola]|uniref:GNAT family N-acetyltransferase n=1 Tax=Paenibacillus fonticola TaxID=379896 RepID=UPI00037ACCBB|nr:GNAT family N-acetyltransferase [Paenibacillus fonticola]
MIIHPQNFDVKSVMYTIRSANSTDAKDLSNIRLQIDGETEYLDREQGEGFIDVPRFARLIKTDTESLRNLFLVAAVDDRIVGFSRCEGNQLSRLSHKVEFGVGVLKEFWGYAIGRNLLAQSVAWADSNGIKKMTLSVLETNDKAIQLYTTFGFKIEGVLRNDKFLSDGKYYNTIVMGRIMDDNQPNP